MSHTIIFDGGPVGGAWEEYPDDEIPLPIFREELYISRDGVRVARYRYGATASPSDGVYRSNYLYDNYDRLVPYAHS